MTDYSLKIKFLKFLVNGIIIRNDIKFNFLSHHFPIYFYFYQQFIILSKKQSFSLVNKLKCQKK